jgi:hypothetical protein
MIRDLHDATLVKWAPGEHLGSRSCPSRGTYWRILEAHILVFPRGYGSRTCLRLQKRAVSLETQPARVPEQKRCSLMLRIRPCLSLKPLCN